MKASSATSATATTPASTGRQSGNRQPSPTRVDEFALSGPSKLPDPAHHAYRKDLADVALAGTVIASHYAEPQACRIGEGASLFEEPSDASGAIRPLDAGEAFLMLDDSLGWAWGYAGTEKRVGYVPSDALDNA